MSLPFYLFFFYIDFSFIYYIMYRLFLSSHFVYNFVKQKHSNLVITKDMNRRSVIGFCPTQSLSNTFIIG